MHNVGSFRPLPRPKDATFSRHRHCHARGIELGEFTDVSRVTFRYERERIARFADRCELLYVYSLSSR